jgi:hypothetical protein
MEKKRSAVLSVIVLCGLSLVLTWCVSASAQRTSGRPAVVTNSVANDPIAFDVSPPLRSMPVQAMALQGTRLMHPPLRPKLQQLKAAAAAQGKAPARGATLSSSGPLISATVGLSFDGISGDPGSAAIENCPLVSGVQLAPPDTNLAVGDTQVVQWVNICYSVYSKATGALIAGPFPGNHFWAGFSNSVCSFQNAGDIIIQWDKANHVWMASQNVFGPYLTCVAVSTSADATGSYNRYQFVQPGFPDYPKWGLTPNVYYQTQNDFGANDGFKGVNVCAYDAVAMRAGKKAKQVCILDNSNGTLFDDSMLPADSDSTGVATTSEVLLGSIDNFFPGDTHVYQYVFTVNLKKGTATLAGVNGSMPISVPAFNLALCSPSGFLTTACVPQPSPGSDMLDTLGDRLMYRLARSVDSSGTQHFLVTHSVNNTTAVAARWYEFTAPSGSTSLSRAQSGDTPDDGEYRWMGSIARDKNGDIALGYSRSSAAAGDYPSIYYSGQTAGESAGTTDAESLIWQGGGSQSNTDNRWGDYSSMVLDGTGSCTFWYTTEYYPFDGSFQWYTHIASLKFPKCH